MFRALTLVLILFTAGCICFGGVDNAKDVDNPGGASTRDSGDGLFNGITESLKGGGDIPQYCTPPKEAYSLSLSDCDKETKSIQRYSCISAVALIKGDATICEKITTKEFMGACVGVIAACKKDDSICELLNEDLGMSYTCIAIVAEVKKDATLCSEMENPKYKNPCITGVATALGSIDLCDRIDDSNEKDRCVKAVAIKTKEAKLCERISGKIDHFRQECVMEVSMAAQDMSLCAALDTGSRAGKTNMETCVKNISLGKNSPSTCDAIKVEDIRDYLCLTPIAVKTKDVTICTKITDDTRRINCAKQVALEAGDGSICEKISLPANQMRGSFGKNDCLSAVAKSTKNKALCDRIEDNTNAKRSCITDAG